jgi:ActR/RegA family two-component response regulator
MTTQVKNVLLVDDEKKLLNSIAQRMEVLGFRAVHGNQWHGGN